MQPIHRHLFAQQCGPTVDRRQVLQPDRLRQPGQAGNLGVRAVPDGGGRIGEQEDVRVEADGGTQRGQHLGAQRALVERRCTQAFDL